MFLVIICRRKNKTQELLTKKLLGFILVLARFSMAYEETRLKTLVSGVGNTILSDDGAGYRVARSLKCRFDADQVTILETSRNWLDKRDPFPGYVKAIIIKWHSDEAGKGR